MQTSVQHNASGSESMQNYKWFWEHADPHQASYQRNKILEEVIPKADVQTLKWFWEHADPHQASYQRNKINEAMIMMEKKRKRIERVGASFDMHQKNHTRSRAYVRYVFLGFAFLTLIIIMREFDPFSLLNQLLESNSVSLMASVITIVTALLGIRKTFAGIRRHNQEIRGEF